MKYSDDTPELGEFKTPYPKNPVLDRDLLKDSFKGFLIVFEGGDGSGKTTQVKLLHDFIKTYSQCNTFSFIKNDFTKPIMLRGKWENYDPYTAALIYTTSLTQMFVKQVIDRLRNNEVVILDRYIYSIISRSIIRGVNEDWASLLVSHLPEPNLIIYGSAPAELCLQRKTNLNEKFSYWESGVDIFGDDEMRYQYDTIQFQECFIKYQTNLNYIASKVIRNTKAPVLELDFTMGVQEIATYIREYIISRRMLNA